MTPLSSRLCQFIVCDRLSTYLDGGLNSGIRCNAKAWATAKRRWSVPVSNDHLHILLGLPLIPFIAVTLVVFRHPQRLPPCTQLLAQDRGERATWLTHQLNWLDMPKLHRPRTDR